MLSSINNSTALTRFSAATKNNPSSLTLSDQSFNDQLLAAFKESLSKLGISSDQIQMTTTSDGGREVVASGRQRQITVTFPGSSQTSVADVQNALAASSPAAATAAIEPDSTAESGPLSLLKEKLRAIGIDPEPLNLTESHDKVGWGGGWYSNDIITAHFPNGEKEDYSFALTGQIPHITARIIGELLPLKSGAPVNT